jgi:hypothetical protein
MVVYTSAIVLDAHFGDLTPHHPVRHPLRLGGEAADREMLDLDIWMTLNPARREGPPLVASQVADQPHAEWFERLDVVVGQPLEAVGAVHAIPPHAAAVAGHVAAKVAEVDDPLHRQPPLRCDDGTAVRSLQSCVVPSRA